MTIPDTPDTKYRIKTYITKINNNLASPLSNTIVTFNREFTTSKNILTDLYQYYFYNGFQNIVTERLVKLLISYTLLFIINFLINCINYSNLILLDTTPAEDHTQIYNYITITNWFPTNPYLIICFSIYILYILAITLNTVTSIKKFWRIRKIYNKYLQISDYKLKFLTWDNIVDTIIARIQNQYYDDFDTNSINIYTINNKICHQSNMIISLLRSDVITMPKMTTFLEWNFVYCIIDPIMRKIDVARGNELENVDNVKSTNEIPINSNIEEIVDGILPFTNAEIYNLNQPLIDYRDTINEIENGTDFYGKITYNLEEIKVDSENSVGSKDVYTTQSLIKSPTKFDEFLFNTFINQSIVNGEITQCNEYVAKVIYRINLVLFLNVVCLPFIIPIVLIYFIIKYGEKMYSNSSILFERVINIKTGWQLRYYNELPDLYQDRIARIQRNMKKITRSYTAIFTQIILRFFTFLIGSIFIIVLAISFIAGNGFTELRIISGHNVVWFLGIVGTLLIILNKLGSNNNGEKLLRCEIVAAFDTLKDDLITVNPKLNEDSSDREFAVSMVNDIYRYRIFTIFEELFYLFISPYYLWRWKKDIRANSVRILGLVEEHHQLGWVPKFSVFTNLGAMQRDPHMMLSYREFKKNHNWEFSGGVFNSNDI